MPIGRLRFVSDKDISRSVLAKVLAGGIIEYNMEVSPSGHPSVKKLEKVRPKNGYLNKTHATCKWIR